MAQQLVPPSTRIRPSRVHNIDDDRLLHRHLWLKENASDLAKNIDGPDTPGGRNRLGHLAQEILAVENELEKRSL